MGDAYRIATDEELREHHCCSNYDLLLGPNGFECLLTEPEDRIWLRDGRNAIKELNRQHALLDRAMVIIGEAIMDGMPVTDEVAAVRNEFFFGTLGNGGNET